MRHAPNRWHEREDQTQSQRLKTLIDAKIKGHEVVAPAEEEEPPEVVNLMEALKRSVAQANTRRPASKRSRRRSA